MDSRGNIYGGLYCVISGKIVQVTFTSTELATSGLIASVNKIKKAPKFTVYIPLVTVTSDITIKGYIEIRTDGEFFINKQSAWLYGTSSYVTE